MYYIYGVGIDLEHSVLDDSEKFPSKNSDIKINLCNSLTHDLNNQYVWYHHWNKPEDENWWLSAGRCRNGSYLLRLENAVDFLISPTGDLIQYHVFGDFKDLNVGKALFNQIIPMVLNLRGIETLHASCVLSTKGAIAFIGNGGYGKSTIAAGLVYAGLKLLSDDAVPIILDGKKLWTSSGIPRMGLWQRSRDLLEINIEIDNPSDKAFVKLSPMQYKHGNFPLTHIYFLNPSDKTTNTSIISMETQEIFIELTRAAHRLDLTNNAMLKHQFNILHQTAKLITARKLIYHRDISNIKELCQTVLFDLESSVTNDLQEVPENACIGI